MVDDLNSIEFRILIKDENNYYYVANVKLNGSEVFCSFPDAGFHLTEHKSGEVHITAENSLNKQFKGIPIIASTGSAGVPCGNGFRHMTTKDLGVAYSIADFTFPINSLDVDFKKYHRRIEGCFIVDKGLLPKDTDFVKIEIWYVPSRNTYSFEFNNKGIADGLMYKLDKCEPQIWSFAKPF
ncbi:MAG: hypothetical protein PHF74_08025 [Dehalococcoidales bacterium]|nr:hypothetical protein [Dehalococcoidales bacterium]